jgi:hypothetical protein
VSALLLVWSLGCGGADLPCEQRPQAEQDACWAEAAVQATDASAVRSALATVRDPRTRDLAWLTAVRAGHPIGCEGLLERSLRDACRDLVARPHLGIGARAADAGEDAAGHASVAVGAAGRDPSCAAVEPALADACAVRLAAGRTGSAALSTCATIADRVLAAECVTRAAAALGASGELPHAQAACASIVDDLWVAECRFRVSEEASGTVTARADLCREAGRFRDECTFHLVRREAGRGAAVAERVSLDATVLELERAAAETVPAAAAVSGQQHAALARLFWHEAAFALFLAAAERGVLIGAPVFPPLGRAPDGTDRATAFDDVRAMLTVRLALEDASRPAPTMLAASIPEEPSTPTLDPGHAPLLPPAPRGPNRYPKVRIGEVPPPLGNAACPVDAPERAALVALWAAEGAPWPRSAGLLEAALAHPSTVVRAQAVDVAEWKAFFHHADDGAALSEVRAALARAAAADPDARIRARAALVVQGVDSRTRPGRWGELAHLCGPRG